MANLPLEQNQKEVSNEILKAATGRLLLTIRYRDKDGSISERVVEPYEYKAGKLFAYCRNKEGIRAFIPENIMAAQATETVYEPRFPVKIVAAS